MTNTQRKILGELSHFGLNPQDWALIAPADKNNASVVIQHKKKKNFKLLAHCDWGVSTCSLMDLCLYSL